MSGPDEFGEKKGRMNAYTCDRCGRTVLTVNADTGVTPFLIGCVFRGRLRKCHGTMRSHFYQIGPRLPGPPTHEWYRPDEKELKRMSRSMREYHGKGAMALRRRTQP